MITRARIRSLIAVAGLLAALASGGCDPDGEGDAGAGMDGASADSGPASADAAPDDGGGGRARCLAACQAVADACPVDASYLESCRTGCAGIPSECRAVEDAYYDCFEGLSGAALCNATGCESEFAAFGACLGPDAG